jgi:hypothetical protein
MKTLAINSVIFTAVFLCFAQNFVYAQCSTVNIGELEPSARARLSPCCLKSGEKFNIILETTTEYAKLLPGYEYVLFNNRRDNGGVVIAYKTAEANASSPGYTLAFDNLDVPYVYETTWYVYTRCGTEYSILGSQIFIKPSTCSTGSISPANPSVCPSTGSPSVTLTLNNVSGIVEEWQWSTSGMGTWNTISGSANNTCAEGANKLQWTVNPSTNTYYRAKVNGNYTTSVLVTVCTPTQPGNITPSEREVCQGTNVNLTLENYSGTIGGWEMSTPVSDWTTAPGSTNSNQYTVSSGTAAGTYFFRAKVNGNPSSIATVIINPIPNFLSSQLTPLPSPLCPGQTFNVTINNTTAGWTYKLNNQSVTSSANGSSVTIYGLTAPSAGLTTWALSVVSDKGCQSVTTNVDVNVQNCQTGSLSASPTEICSGGSSILTLNGSSGTVEKWEASTDSGSSWTTFVTGNVTTPQTVTPSVSTQYRVKVNGSYTNVVTVTVNPAATASDISISGNTTICSGEKPTLTANSSGIGNPEYKWYESQISTTALFIGQTFTPSSGLTSSRNYYVTVSGTGYCENTPGNRKEVAITVNQRPLAPAIGDVDYPNSVCAGQPVEIVIKNVTPGMSYKIYSSATSGAQLMGSVTASGNVATVQIPSAPATEGTYKWYVSSVAVAAPYCETDIPNRREITFSVKKCATGTITPFSSAVCQGTSVTLTLNSWSGTVDEWKMSTSGASGTWTTITGSAGQAFYTVPSNFASGTYHFYAVVNGVATNVVTVTINPVPSAPLAVSSVSGTICSGEPFKITVQSPTSGYTYYVYDANGNQKGMGTATGSGDLEIPVIAPSVNEAWTVLAKHGQGGCESQPSAQIAITVRSDCRTGTLTASPTVLCEGSSAKLSLQNWSGSLDRWEQSNSVGGLWTVLSGTEAPKIVTPSVGTTYYRAIVNGVETNTVSVTVNPVPASPTLDATLLSGLCAESPYNITVQSAIPGYTYYVYDINDVALGSATATSSGALGIPVTTPTAGSSVRWYVRVKHSQGGCESPKPGTAVDITNLTTCQEVTVTATPGVICEGSGMFSTLKSSGNIERWEKSINGQPGSWTTVTDWGTVPSINITSPVGTTWYRAIVNGTPTNTVSITVNPQPPVPVPTPPHLPNVCRDALLNITVTSAVQGLTYEVYEQNTGLLLGSTVASSSGTLDIPITAPSSDGVLSIIAKNSHGCTSPPSALVQVNLKDCNTGILSASTTSICENGSATLTVSNYEGSIDRWEYSDSPSGTWIYAFSAGATVTLNSSNAPATGTVYYRVIVNGVPTNYVGVTIIKLPAKPDVAPNKYEKICRGEPFKIRIPSAIQGYTYVVYDAFSSPITSAVSNVNGELNIQVTAPLTDVAWYVSARNSSGCESTEKAQVSITVKDCVPGTVTATPDVICADGTSYSLLKIGFYSGHLDRWETSESLSGPWTPAFYGIAADEINVTSSLVPTLGTLWYRAVVDGVETSAVSITINAVPSEPVVDIPTSPVCSGKPFSITVTSAEAGYNYYIEDNNGNQMGTAFASGAGALNIPTVAPLNTGHYTWTVYADNGGCRSAGKSVPFDVHQCQTGAVSPADTAVCLGASVTLKLTGHTGTVDRWESSPTGTSGTWTTISGTENNGTVLLTVNTSTSGKYYYRATVNGTATNIATVDVKSAPQAPASGDVSVSALICAGKHFELTVSPANANYIYHIYNGSGVEQTPVNAVYNAGKYTVTLTAPANAETWHVGAEYQTAPHCTTAPADRTPVDIDVQSCSAGVISPDSSAVCQGTGVYLTLSGFSGIVNRWETATSLTGTWTTVSGTENGSGNAAGNVTSYTVSSSTGVGTYYYRALVNGNKYSDTATVIIRPHPPVPLLSQVHINPALPLCIGQTFTVTVDTVAMNGTYDLIYTLNGYSDTVYAGSESAAVFRNLPAPPSNADWTLSVRSLEGGCQSAVTTVKIEVQPCTCSISPSDTAVCPAGTAILRLVCQGSVERWETSTTGLTGSWTTVSGTENNGPNQLTVTPVDTVYYRAVVNGNDVTNVVRVTVNQFAAASDITVTGTDSVCTGDKPTLTAGSSITNPVFNWYDSQTSSIILFTGTTFTPSAGITVSQSYFVSVSGDGFCENNAGDRAEFVVTVKTCTGLNDDYSTVTENSDSTLIVVTGNDNIPCSGHIFGIADSAKHGAISLSGDSAVRYTPAQNWTGLDSASYYVRCGLDSATAKVYILTVKPLSRSYVACPGASAIMGFASIPNVTFKWYDHSNVWISDGDTLTTVKNSIDITETWFAEPVYNGKPFPRIKVELQRSDNCQTTTPSGCAVTGTLLFMEDFEGNELTDSDEDCGYIPHFNSTYTRGCPYISNYGGETYFISKTVKVPAGNTWHSTLTDHTHSGDPDRGYFAGFDATDRQGVFFEHAIDSLCSNVKKLHFSAWLVSLSSNPLQTGKANLIFVIEDSKGNTLARFYTGDLSDGDPTWRNFGFEFDMPENARSLKLKLKIINNGSETSGNDFGIDDIEIRFCVPQVELDVPVDIQICTGADTVLKAHYTDDGAFGNSLKAQWYKNTTDINDPSAWLKVGTEQSSANGYISHSYAVNSASHSDAGWYRLVVSDGAGINGGYFCRAMSDIVRLNAVSIPTPPDIRLNIQKPSSGLVALNPYLDSITAFGHTVNWQHSDIVNASQGILNVSHWQPQSTYTLTYTVNAQTCGSASAKAYIRIIDGAHVKTSTVYICKDLEMSKLVNLNSILGVYADGAQWTYPNDVIIINNITVAQAGSQYEGARFFNAQQAFQQAGTAYDFGAGMKKFEFQYSETASGISKKLILIVY